MTRHGFALADIKSLTAVEVRTYIELLAEAASGAGGKGKKYINHRLKRDRGR